MIERKRDRMEPTPDRQQEGVISFLATLRNEQIIPAVYISPTNGDYTVKVYKVRQIDQKEEQIIDRRVLSHGEIEAVLQTAKYQFENGLNPSDIQKWGKVLKEISSVQEFVDEQKGRKNPTS